MRIGRKRMYLWRAVDHEHEVVDMLVQSRRDIRAALVPFGRPYNAPFSVKYRQVIREVAEPRFQSLRQQSTIRSRPARSVG